MATGEPELKYSVCLKCNDAVLYEDIDPRSGICRYCVERAEFVRSNQAATNGAKKALQEIIRNNRPTRINAPHISELWSSVIGELGSVDKAAQLLVEDYLDCRERNPGGQAALRFWECIARMARDSSSMRDSAPDAINLTDEQLAGEMLHLVEQVAQQNRLEYNKSILVEALLQEHGQDTGRKIEGPDGGVGDGESSPPAGGPEMLPPDP